MKQLTIITLLLLFFSFHLLADNCSKIGKQERAIYKNCIKSSKLISYKQPKMAKFRESEYNKIKIRLHYPSLKYY